MIFMAKKLPQGLRKFIRREKARIRREVLDIKKQEELINELYQKFIKEVKEEKLSSPLRPVKRDSAHENKRNLQSGNKQGD